LTKLFFEKFQLMQLHANCLQLFYSYVCNGPALLSAEFTWFALQITSKQLTLLG